MAVPGATSNYLKNTANGTYVAAQEGGTILGNTETGSVITKALGLNDNAAVTLSTLPREKSNGLVANQKVLSGGTFAYEVAGQYVIATISSTLSGVASTKVLITGQGEDLNPIHKFRHDFGANTTTLFRRNRYSYTGFKTNGDDKFKKRSANLFTAANGHTHATPSTNTGVFMYDIADGNNSNIAFDSAAEPIRAIPGELVMKVDFVTLTVASGGDFFDYKEITGM